MLGATDPGTQAGRTDSVLRSSFGVRADRNAVRFDLSVINVGKKHVELAFPNGEAYDFVVLDSAGREVWRWRNGRMFTQTVRTKLLGTGDGMRVDERWDRPNLRGRYTAVATLNSSNHPVERRVDFELQ